MRKHRRRGFTLPEVIVVILIISILAAMALPKFFSFREEAKNAVEKQEVGSIRVAITNYYIESILEKRTPLYPEALDSANLGYAAPDNPLFTNVLAPPGVTTGEWRKLSSTTYEGYSGAVYTYNPEEGTFNQ